MPDPQDVSDEPPLISIRLIKDADGNYAVGLHPLVLSTSPEDEDVHWLFTLDGSIDPALAPVAKVSFTNNPFPSHPSSFDLAAESVCDTGRPTLGVLGNSSNALFKYDVRIVVPDETPNGVELARVDPHIMVKRTRVRPNFYGL